MTEIRDRLEAKLVNRLLGLGKEFDAAFKEFTNQLDSVLAIHGYRRSWIDSELQVLGRDIVEYPILSEEHKEFYIAEIDREGNVSLKKPVTGSETELSHT